MRGVRLSGAFVGDEAGFLYDSSLMASLIGWMLKAGGEPSRALLDLVFDTHKCFTHKFSLAFILQTL